MIIEQFFIRPTQWHRSVTAVNNIVDLGAGLMEGLDGWNICCEEVTVLLGKPRISIVSLDWALQSYQKPAAFPPKSRLSTSKTLRKARISRSRFDSRNFHDVFVFNRYFRRQKKLNNKGRLTFWPFLSQTSLPSFSLAAFELAGVENVFISIQISTTFKFVCKSLSAPYC